MTDPANGNWLHRRPWSVGLLCALAPLMVLWATYPFKWDSRTVRGQAFSADIRGVDDIITTGTQGAISVHCYELELVYGFEIGDTRYTDVQAFGSCELPRLKRLRKTLLAGGVTVVYSAGNPSTAFVLELVSVVKLKVDAALAMTAFLLGTRAFGQWAGVYRQDSWNIPLAQVKPRFWILTALLVLFYGSLIVF